MVKNKISLVIANSEIARSVLTGEFIMRGSEEFRHELEVGFLSSLSSKDLEDILIGLSGNNSHRSITAIRGPAEVKFLRSEIILFRDRTDAALGHVR